MNGKLANRLSDPSLQSPAPTKSLADCTVAIAGLGLMGGSLGLALRGKAACVVGIARRAETVEQALAIGAIDAGASDLSAAGNAIRPLESSLHSNSPRKFAMTSA